MKIEGKIRIKLNPGMYYEIDGHFLGLVVTTSQERKDDPGWSDDRYDLFRGEEVVRAIELLKWLRDHGENSVYLLDDDMRNEILVKAECGKIEERRIFT